MTEHREMPLGLSFRMSANEKALDAYAKMTEEEKEEIIEEARHVRSKKEMQALVERMSAR